jgi:hypothetical protein
MSFSDLIDLLSPLFPLRLTHGVHQFNVKNTHLQLMGDDHMLTAMVTPGALFATHLRSAGGGGLLVAFKSDAPECVGISGFDGEQSLMFRGINTSDDAPLLLKTLILIIDFEDRLSEMVCDLWEKFADPRWSITIQPTSTLDIEHECGSISLTHVEDCVYVSAYPLVGIYDRFIAWSGLPTFDGLRSGTLMLGDAVFVGAKDGVALSFAYRFPDDEDEIRGVMAALVWIFRAHLEKY